ncbi:YbaY family lipoprotein [Pseudodesulfovibrio indicus]|uniref:YbaY family lipoprotein n=1 Tax=Pseudodesulfovibrio indicus TaxID=1716143 RepID=UPI00292D1085|nr:YbaY family lipoprotein [Pseudodesulfovibrio indicus]
MKRTIPGPVLWTATLLALLPVFLLSAGCAEKRTEGPAVDPAATAQLRASVTYRARMLLPPRCTMFLSLEDLSRLDPTDRTVASTFIPVQAAPPFSAVLRYDPAKIHQRLRYALAARIELNGQVLFVGSARIDPFAQPEDEPVEILVVPPPKKTR